MPEKINHQWLVCILLLLCACSEPKNHPAPNEYFFQVGLFGHGRGVLGDLNINTFTLQRRCDTCHKVGVEQHGKLGTCNRCHQPNYLGWSESLFSEYHGDVMSFNDKSYHQKLKCTQCHQDTRDEQSFNTVSCNHCHNHGRSDMNYAHDLLDNYNYSQFSKNSACISCHSKKGEHYVEYYDVNSDELL